jgi:hypothetical protein
MPALISGMVGHGERGGPRRTNWVIQLSLTANTKPQASTCSRRFLPKPSVPSHHGPGLCGAFPPD